MGTSAVQPTVATAPLARWPRVAGEALLAIFFAAGALRLYLLTLSKDFVRSAVVAEGVVRGEPPWRIYQSRVLGPYFVHALGVATRTPIPIVYGVVALGLLFVAGFLILRRVGQLGDPTRPPLAAFFTYQAFLILLLPCIWLYVWDLISLVVFVLFNAFVLRGAGRWRLAALAILGVLNHEITLVVAAWMVLDPIVKRLAGHGGARSRAGRTPRLDRAGVLLGLVVLAGGAALIETLRRVLLVREVPPDAGDTLSAHAEDFHFTLARNWDAIVHSFSFAPQKEFQFVVPLFLVLVLVVAALLARSNWPRFGALAIVTTGMVVLMLCFGLILETRVLLPLVPFVAMNRWAVLRGGSAGAKPRGA
jgi:hypothetical protein